MKPLIALTFLLCFICPAFAQPLSGTYTIGGTAPNYPQLAQAVADLVAKGVSGKVIFNIRSGQYEERVTIPAITGASADNTITFQSESGNPADVRIYSAGSGFANDHHTIKLNGADHITFRKLTLETTGITFASIFHLTDRADFNTIEGCVLLADSTPENNVNNGSGTGGNYLRNYIGAIVVAGTPEPLSTDDITKFLIKDNNANNLTIKGNTFLGGSYAIIIKGPDTGRDTGFVITDNTISNCFRSGIELESTDKVEVLRNNVTFSILAEGEVHGIYLYTSKRFLVDRNYVRGALSYGLRLVLVDGQASNNFIAGGYRPNSATRGISVVPSGGTFIKIYNNSVHYDALGNGGFAFYAFNSSGKVDVKNNIFYHSGGGYAICLQAADPNKNINFDYNNYYSKNAAGTTFFFAKAGTTDCADLAAWRTLHGTDQNSLSVNPAFVSGSDLHTLSPLLDMKGLPIAGITEDIDGQPRNVHYPDIGADEYVIKPKDIAILDVGPAYPVLDTNKVTAILINDGLTSLKDSTVSLSYSTDGGITWSQPENYTFTGLKSTYSTEVYTFNTPWIVNRIKHFDLCVRVNSPGLISDNNKTNDVFCKQLCVGMQGGTFTVGTPASHFENLAEVQNYLQTAECELEGPVIFDIQPGTYEERLVIPYLNGMSATNTITFRSATGKAEDAVISSAGSTGEVTHSTIQLRGANYVTLENLTIKNTGRNYASGVHLTLNAHHNTIRNCTITLDSFLTASYSIGIVCSDTAILQGETITHDNHFIDNTLTGGSAGIRVYGKPTKLNNGLIISGNKIRMVSDIGISVFNTNLNAIDMNKVEMNDSSEISLGLFVLGCKSDASISGNYIANAAIAGMRLENIESPQQFLVSNNMITGAYRNSDEGYGVYLSNTDNLQFLHNSLLYNRENTLASAALLSDNGENIRIKNNILVNTGGGYALRVNVPAAITESDYNDLYTTGPFLTWWVEDQAALSDHQAASSKDLASLSADPVFASLKDLHITGPLLEGKGAPSDIAFDFDGESRNPVTPDIGADEFSIGIDGGVSGFIALSDTMEMTGSQPLQVTVHNYGTSLLEDFHIFLWMNGTQLADQVFSGTLTPNASAVHSFGLDFTPTGEGTYTFKSATSIPGDISAVNDTAYYTIEVISTGIEPAAKESFSIYPNPASDILYIQHAGKYRTLDIEVFDMLGQRVLVSKQSQNRIDVSTLPDGIYLLRASAKDHFHYAKFIVDKN